jgi:hypothetical protein
MNSSQRVSESFRYQGLSVQHRQIRRLGPTRRVAHRVYRIARPRQRPRHQVWSNRAQQGGRGERGMKTAKSLTLTLSPLHG